MHSERRPWGTFQVLHADARTWLKRLVVDAGQALSVQYHQHRDEFWYPLAPGLRATIDVEDLDLEPMKVYSVPRLVVHRISNVADYPIALYEFATGMPDENDIVRIEDNYGRS